MTRIPKKLREQLAVDMFYSRCCITGLPSQPGDRIEWHHNMIFAGKQVQERFAILPVLSSIHRRANEPDIKDKLDWIMLSRMTTTDLYMYGKGINWFNRLERLEDKFGKFVPWQEGAIAY